MHRCLTTVPFYCKIEARPVNVEAAIKHKLDILQHMVDSHKDADLIIILYCALEDVQRSLQRSGHLQSYSVKHAFAR